jgi:hypothetical protein
MNKKVLGVILIILIIFSFSNISFAAGKPTDGINADPVFDSITITLTTSKNALFSAYTNDIVGSIKVASCWLQKKVGNNWTYYCWLPAPSDESNNTIGYESSMNYSSYIPSDGNTYRVAGRFVADGHHATRYSNQRSF